MGLLNKRSGPEKVKREVTIVNKLGLHARPAAMFVRVANKHRAEIWVEKDGEQVNGKSIMGLMMLSAAPGSILLISYEGCTLDEFEGYLSLCGMVPDGDAQNVWSILFDEPQYRRSIY